MRILLGILGALIALIVIALVVVAINLNGIVRSSVESVGPTYTGTTVTLEEVDLSLFSGEGELRGLVVGQPEGYEGEPAFRLASIRIALEPSSLLEDTILIRELVIDGAEINALVRGAREQPAGNPRSRRGSHGSVGAGGRADRRQAGDHRPPGARRYLGHGPRRLPAAGPGTGPGPGAGERRAREQRRPGGRRSSRCCSRWSAPSSAPRSRANSGIASMMSAAISATGSARGPAV
ncbi:MAG: hypothetical protein U5R48_17645 [Gammaproteobacteria bacterium]|nr:hypothetical protein [Gammaproteobacteria bacterium]